MKNLLFLTYYQADPTEGIWKKIESQVRAMRKIGFNVDFFYMEGKNIVYDDGINIKKIQNRFKHKYFYYLNVKKHIEEIKKQYDFLYVRKPHGGLFCLGLPFIINSFDESFIIMEIPTYPYINEIKTIKDKFLEAIFNISKRTYIKKIDKIAYFGKPVDKIWGVNAVGLSNGIDVDAIRIAKQISKPLESEFTIVAVANLSFWHGYDRILAGLRDYKDTNRVMLYVVGDLEPEYSRLKELAKEYSIEDKVIFTGRLSGQQLDEVFNKADVCVDALGRHRSGNEYNSSIKSKEYCARGLPFIKSHIDPAFANNDFIYQATADETPIDIADVIQWRSNLSSDISQIERTFAEQNLTWQKQFIKLFFEV